MASAKPSLVPNFVRSLAGSAVFAAVQKVVESGGLDPGQTAVASGLIATAAGYLVNLGTSQYESARSEAERTELATRNHHLRRGMAVALRKAIDASVARLDVSLAEQWISLLRRAETDDGVLERVFPPQLAEPGWEATNAYREDHVRDGDALATLLHQWLTPSGSAEFTPDKAREYARILLPAFRQAFADDLASDEKGLLFQAFVVKGLQQSTNGQKRVEELVREVLRRLDSKPRPPESFRATTLPYATGFFTGRDSLLRDLHAQLQAQREALLTAPGGFGKTQTALEYARRFGGHYSDVAWVSAFSNQSMYESAVAIAGLSAAEAIPESDVQNGFRRWMAANPEALAIFDNVDDPSILEGYWPGPGTRPAMLVTSQSAALDSLDRLTAFAVETWSPEECVEFLQARLGAAAAFDASAALELGVETEGLPLALEQAGAYMRHTRVGLGPYFQKFLDIRTRLLAAGGPEAGRYHSTVATTWLASRERLSQASRDLLDGLSHLSPRGVPLELLRLAGEKHLGEAVAAVFADEVQVDPLATVLGGLRDYSLVRVDEEAQTVSMHRLLHEVVCERQEAGVREEWMGRWIGAFGEFLPAEPGHEVSPPHERGWVAFLHFFSRVPEGASGVAGVG